MPPTTFQDHLRGGAVHSQLPNGWCRQCHYSPQEPQTALAAWLFLDVHCEALEAQENFVVSMNSFGKCFVSDAFT